MALWALSVIFYLGAVFATLLLPVPKFGVVRHGHFYGVPGAGEWVSHPNIVHRGGIPLLRRARRREAARKSRLVAEMAAAQPAQSRKSSSAASR